MCAQRLDDWTLYCNLSSKLETYDDTVSLPDDFREMSQFLAKQGWIRHLEGISKAEISAITSLPKQEEMLEPVSHAVYAIMSNLQGVICSSGFHVRRLLGLRPS